MAERQEIAKIEEFSIEVCSRCGSVKLGTRWVQKEIGEVIEEMVFKNARVVEEFDVREIAVTQEFAVFRGNLAGDEIEVSVPLKYEVNRVLCQKCSREAGGYYESIVQLRADRELSDEEIERTLEIVNEVISRAPEDQKAFISKLERKKEGINIFLGSRNIGKKISRMILREFGGTLTESKKIHTRIDGREAYRFTYSVRLPEYREGDVVERDGRFLVVRNPKMGKGVDIITGRTINLSNERVVVRREKMRDGVVVNADENAVEVVCDDGGVVTTPKPAGVRIGDEVRVFEVNGKHYSINKIYEGRESAKK